LPTDYRIAFEWHIGSDFQQNASYQFKNVLAYNAYWMFDSHKLNWLSRLRNL
jgi:hypothetical protein